MRRSSDRVSWGDRMTVRRVPVALALAALIALAGCGTSEGMASPSGTAPPASRAASTPASSAPSESAPPGATETPAATVTASPTPAATATPEPTPTTQPEPTGEPVYQSIEDVEIGQCFMAIRDVDDESVLAASIVDCAQPHDSELFALELLEGAPDAPYPGDRALDDLAIELCDAAFEAYVGVDYQDSVYEYSYFTPSEATWSIGDREVICVIEHADEPNEGSVRGSNN